MEGLGLTTTQAGLLGTAEFASIMVGSLAVSPFMNRVPRKSIALIGALSAILLNVICGTVHPLPYIMLLVVRALTGLSCGLAMSAGNATVSNARDPERMSAQMSTGYVIMFVLACLIFPVAGVRWGYSGVYLALAGMMLVFYPFLLGLPQRPPADVDKINEHDRLGSNVGKVGSLSAVAILLAMLMFTTRDMAGWTFVERLGTEAGYTAVQVGRLLSAQGAFGVIGPLIASILGSRRGLTLPIVAGVIATGLPYVLMLFLPGSKTVFTVSALFLSTTYFFTQAYLIALAAELDRKGRVVAAAGAFVSGGSALGPALGGYLIGNYGYADSGAAMIVMITLTVFLALIAIRGKRRAITPVAMLEPSTAS